MPEITVMELVVKLLEAATVGYGEAGVYSDVIKPTTKAEDLRFLGGYCPLHGRELHIYDMTLPENAALREGGMPVEHPLQGLLGTDPAEYWKMV